MFGHRYFGARYYGPRYWGKAVSGAVAAVVNFFKPTLRGRRR